MRRPATLLIASLIVLLALPAAAQQEPGTLAQEYWMNVKPGMGGAFEQGYNKHNEWHRKNDSWPWETWQVLVGENVGSYVIRTGGHRWEDFDANAETLAAGGADFGQHVIASVESINSRMVTFLPEASSWTPGGDRPALVTVLEYRIRYEAAADFVQAIRKINQGLKKSASLSRPAAWFEVIRGGAGEPTYVLVFPHENWGDMNAPANPFWARVEEAFGPDETKSLRAVYRKAIISRRSMILAYRADLSSIPEGK